MGMRTPITGSAIIQNLGIPWLGLMQEQVHIIMGGGRTYRASEWLFVDHMGLKFIPYTGPHVMRYWTGCRLLKYARNIQLVMSVGGR